MKNMDHKQAAQMLWEAEQGRYQIDMLTQTHPDTKQGSRSSSSIFSNRWP